MPIFGRGYPIQSAVIVKKQITTTTGGPASQSVSGSISSSGSLTMKVIRGIISGSISSSGLLTKMVVKKALSGTITPSAAILNSATKNKILSGTALSAGALSTLYIVGSGSIVVPTSSNFANILVGPATMLISSDGISYTDLGATADGIIVSWEPSFIDVENDQGSTVRCVQKSTKILVQTTLLEATLANLNRFLYTNATLAPGPYFLKVAGPGPMNLIRTYTFTAAQTYQVVNANHQRDTANRMPIAFKIMVNPVNLGSEYGSIVDA